MPWHLLIWLPLLALLGLWTLACWLLHGLLSWEGWRRPVDWELEIPPVELPPWLLDWLGLDVLAWLRELLVAWGPELQAWLAGLPDLGAWMGGLLGLVWLLGVAGLLFVGLVGSVVVAAVRRGRRTAG